MQDSSLEEKYYITQHTKGWLCGTCLASENAGWQASSSKAEFHSFLCTVYQSGSLVSLSYIRIESQEWSDTKENPSNVWWRPKQTIFERQLGKRNYVEAILQTCFLYMLPSPQRKHFDYKDGIFFFRIFLGLFFKF